MKNARTLYNDFVADYNLWYEHINTEEPNWEKIDKQLEKKSDKSLDVFVNHLRKNGIDVSENELKKYTINGILGHIGDRKVIDAFIKKAEKNNPKAMKLKPVKMTNAKLTKMSRFR